MITFFQNVLVWGHVCEYDPHMLNVIMLSVFVMIVVMLRLNILGPVLMSVSMLCVNMFYVIYAESLIVLSAFMLIIVILILDKMGVGVVILSVVILYVI
jgi:hypothetical protein